MNVVVQEAALNDNQSTSSGCESGWTLYLDHSTQPHFDFDCTNYQNPHRGKIACDQDHDNGFYYYNDDDEEEEEEDLSMVSDASSGPPQFDLEAPLQEQQVFCYAAAEITPKTQRFDVQDFSLDDTASSPFILSSSKKKKGGIKHGENQGSSLESMIDYSSQGFSATHFQRRSNDFQDQRYGFLQSPFSTEQYQPNQW